MRSFVGIRLPSSYILESMTRECSEMGRAVNLKNLHITLKFLGEINNIEKIKSSLGGIRFDRFSISLRGVGAFPSERRGRILFVRAFPEDILEKLAKEVDLRTNEIKMDHPFSPHITILRTKQTKDFSNLAGKYENITFLEHPVEQFTLFQSTLKPEGPMYTDLRNYQLI